MKAQETTILRLLQGSKVFLIPNFQRRYAWRRPQWQALWEDLIREYESGHDEYSQELSGHFLGSVVLHPAPGPASTLMRHLVIDGQQRLTTILVLLSALRDVRAERESEFKPASYDAKYLTNPFDDDYPDRLVPTEFDRDPYVQTVRHGRPTGGVGQAYAYFRDNIEDFAANDEANLARLGDVLLIRMLLVEINTSPGDSVNNIFNTLNSKGLPLSATDLVRNELLLNLDEVQANKAYQELWLPMEQHLVSTDAKGNVRDGLFVTFFWAREVASTPNTTKKSLFQSFERRLRKQFDGIPPSLRQERVLSVFREIYDDYRFFLSVLDPYGDGPDFSLELEPGLLEVLEDLRKWGSEPYIPIALWVLRERVRGSLEATDAELVLRTLLGYLVRRAMLGLSTNNLNRLLSPVPTMLANREPSVDAATALRDILMRPGYRWPTDADVLNGVGSQPLYLSIKRSQTHFLLQATERLLAGKGVVDMEGLAIEHVMPQSLSVEWRTSLLEAGDDIDEAESVLHTIGNLTLTDDSARLGDGTFTAKREVLLESPLRLNTAIATNELWDVAAIRKRSVEIGTMLLEHLIGPPAVSRTEDAQTMERELREQLVSSLQSLPEGCWTSEDELIRLLGAESSRVRQLVNDLGPEIARLVRTSGGAVPAWMNGTLAAEVLKQSDDPLVAGFLTDLEIADIARREDDDDWDEVVDPELVDAALSHDG